MEGILNLPVQDPLCPEFSAAHINWVKLEGGRQCGDNIALIPFARVDDFVKGESSNPPMPCEFSRRIKKEETCRKHCQTKDNPAPCEDMQKQGGPQNRDDFLTRNDVRNMERTVRNSSNELHENDECSVKIWVQQHQKHVFYFQDNSSSEPFVLGIQTDWQLQQMLRFGNNSFISFHSSFGLKKLKDPRWRPNAILLDDPSLDYSIIRDPHLNSKWSEILLIAERLSGVASYYVPGMFAVLGLKNFSKNAATLKCNGRCLGIWDGFYTVQNVGQMLWMQLKSLCKFLLTSVPSWTISRAIG
ncbi:hypothetical protein JHK85_014996 [Glycine max]|nr:hypothetical protein JHK85_014996 [Glycine max]KAG5045244.1 hypothetical protein JHK86_014650 [Glycine max]